MSTAHAPPPSLSKTALAVAWLALAAALAGVSGYLVVARQATPTAAFRAPFQEIPMGPVRTALADGQQSTHEADSASGPDPAVADEPAAAAGPTPVAATPEATTDAADTDPSAADPDAPDPASPDPAAPDPAAPVATSPDASAVAEDPPAAPEPPATGSQTASSQTAQPEPAEPETEEPASEAPDPTAQQNAAAAAKPLWQQFASTGEIDRSRPSIAVVVSGLGLSSTATEAAIKHLPAQVTLSFSPYARRLNQWIALARVNGHEVMLDLPMEPVGFPNLDPGPHALLTSLETDQNLARLDWVLKRGTSYVGVAAMMGSRFTASQEHLYPVMKDLQQRGLLFLDNRAISTGATRAVSEQLGMPLLINDRAIDEAQASRIAIDSRLAQVERLALTNGTAVAMGQPYPVTIERLRDWSALLSARGFTLVPITALVQEAASG